MASAFLCHSSHDKLFVRELYRRLTRDGVSCFFDEESIEWGDNYILSLEAGIDRCENLIIILSPEFLNSEWTKIERTSVIAGDPTGLKRKIKPLLLKPCRDQTNFPRFLRPIQHIDVSTPELFERNYAKICTLLDGTPGQDNPLSTDRTRVPAIAPLPARSIMPHRSLENRFVGRITDLWKIHDALTIHTATVIHGIGLVTGTGGLGKTQLSIEYAYRFAPYYPGGIFWIEADQGIDQMIYKLCKALDIEHNPASPIDEQLSALWQTFTALPNTLIILDNFPENEALKPWLPPIGRTHILVTTRRTDLTGYTSIGLNVLSSDEGFQLLNAGNRQHGQEAFTLLEKVGYLPLAVELLRDFLDKRTDIFTQDILDEWANHETISLLDEFSKEYCDELPSGHQKSILKTFELSWNLASKQAQRLLVVMAQLAPTSVPRQFLRAVLQLTAVNRLRDPLGTWIHELKCLSLLSEDSDHNPFAHRLILGFVRHHADNDLELNTSLCNVIHDEMMRVWNEQDIAGFRELESIILHAEAVDQSTIFDASPTQHVELEMAIAKHHTLHGRYFLAQKFYENTLQRAQIAFPTNHTFIAMTQSNLAAVLKDLGKLNEAKELLYTALDTLEKNLDPENPYIASTQSALGLVLKDLGNPMEAKDFLGKAVESYKKNYEPGHPYITSCQASLALVLQDLGELNEARDLLYEALESDKKNFEPNHPTIARTQACLAVVLQSLGEFTEAKTLMRMALDSDMKNFEAGHPTIARSQACLAMILKDLNELPEAEDLMRKALDSDMKSFTPEHSTIARSQACLAMILKDLNKLTEAESLMRKALNSDIKSFAPEHYIIARDQACLAMILKDLGQPTECKDLLLKAIDSCKKCLEPGHPNIARNQWNLASVLMEQGELSEARELLTAAHSIFLTKLGKNHPDTQSIERYLDAIGS